MFPRAGPHAIFCPQQKRHAGLGCSPNKILLFTLSLELWGPDITASSLWCCTAGGCGAATAEVGGESSSVMTLNCSVRSWRVGVIICTAEGCSFGETRTSWWVKAIYPAGCDATPACLSMWWEQFICWSKICVSSSSHWPNCNNSNCCHKIPCQVSPTHW